MFRPRIFRSIGANINRNRKNFGSDHGHNDHHHGPHVPVFYDKLAKFCLVTTYLWIMYRIKEDKGQIFGYYKPWLDEHHHEHLHFIEEDPDKIPSLEEENHDHEDEDHEDEEHDED